MSASPAHSRQPRRLPRMIESVLHPRRFMRSRGFGVHSPFAFNFINGVLRPGRGCTYYAYRSLGAICAESGGRLRVSDMRLLHRMICALRPTAFCAIGPDSGHTVRCAALAARSMTVVSDPARLPAEGRVMILATAEPSASVREAVAARVASGGAALLAIGAPQLAAATDSALDDAGFGMTFSGAPRRGTLMVAVARIHLPRQHFNLIF